MALIGWVPLALEMNVPLNRLVALAFVEFTDAIPFTAVNVQFVQIIDPELELLIAGFTEPAVIVELNALIIPVLKFAMAALAFAAEDPVIVHKFKVTEPAPEFTKFGCVYCEDLAITFD